MAAIEVTLWLQQNINRPFKKSDFKLIIRNAMENQTSSSWRLLTASDRWPPYDQRRSMTAFTATTTATGGLWPPSLLFYCTFSVYKTVILAHHLWYQLTERDPCAKKQRKAKTMTQTAIVDRLGNILSSYHCHSDSTSGRVLFSSISMCICATR